ncbi:hypothetical protein K491DRAFT_776123 [Lophiostoma macrostomum CBS 122681]|uniref:Uncharacterized protein n=1 Tax=Lophiostoma macrostomum CBS 122681 TaxID=1314788 RepID=A0A6A6THX3_9PLEO|nr:hypothetical protein K491DRAFT_776123 [Lophiostoma macrostomum CBS 122681]
MAEQITHDVVKEALSMGGPSPIDEPAQSTNNSAGDGEASSEPPTADPKLAETAFSNPTSTTAANGDSAGSSEQAAGDAVADATANSTEQSKTPDAGPEAKTHLTNGDSGDHSASEEATSQQAAGDGSGASDTDISRPGSVDQAKERPAGHIRSNSVKKPASFKSVSVTKNFLAKSAVSTPAARPGEKLAPAGQASISTQQTAKPRLVAKSGSGIGNVPRSSLSKVNGSGSGPDASKVWNKNQPVPPPPPKQFTDEELKQQYGIHLATRLQADEAGKEAKWADIDDDEDDWAPDTVQWMDGTKSTVATTENQPPPEDPKAVLVEPPVEAPKPTTTTTSSQKPSSTGGSKTILKPGAHAQATSTKSGLVLKGQPEKPTLVAKPSAPTPVKSPWAALPPVDKVSPIPVNPPAQPSPQSRFSQRDSHGYDALPQPLPPAKEIAPDDFNRSWRDERGSRELFNSHSGRYEPVNEMRRGSVRDNFRQQPSVLQRPSHDGPAEPSAAFQTSRSSAEGPTWGRRRNSSNVSGGSGRRMSIDRRAPDLPPMPMSVQRRESHSTNGADAITPGTPRPTFAQKAPTGDQQYAVSEQLPASTQLTSPNLSNVQPSSPYGSVASSSLQDAAAPAPPVQMEDPVEVQNRLMREKLERARLHKQQAKEAEEKEEAEKKERIRKKLESMGLGDESASKKKEQSPARAEKSPHKDHVLPAAVQSPPKPPVPTSEGEIAQYGMMKVHQPHPVKKPYHAETVAHKPLRGPESAPKPSPSPVKAEAEVQPKPAGASTETLPQPPTSHNLTGESKTQSETSQEQSQSRTQSLEVEARAGSQTLKPTQPPPGAWTSTSLPRQSAPWGNVWGPPQAKDRALGNGTFDAPYSRDQPRPSPQQLPAQSQPTQASEIGLTPSVKQPSVTQPQVAPGQPFARQTMYVKNEPAPAQQAKPTPRPGPIGPPQAKGVPQVKGAWGNFATAIRLDDQALVAKNQQELKRMGGEVFRPEIREKFTDQQGKSQQTLHTKIGGPATLPATGIKLEASTTPEPKPKDDLTKSTYATVVPTSEATVSQSIVNQSSHVPPPGPATRSSRFFPRASEASTQHTVVSNKTDSSPPPPPETEAHPAFTGSSTHPVVKMPKPPPRVRLPPAAVEPATAPPPVTMPSRPQFGFGARPLALDPEWQARFNSLLHTGTSPAAPVSMPKLPNSQTLAQTKPGALAIAASSKAPLDVRGTVASATVSLPNSAAKKTFAEDTSSEVTTRLPAEDVLLEDREFGSLPIVRTPKVPHLAANERPVSLNVMRPNFRWPKQLVTTTRPMLNLFDFDRDADGIDVRVRFGNMHEAITKIWARKSESRKSPAREKPGRYSPRGGRGRQQPIKAGTNRSTPPTQTRSYHIPKNHTVAPTTS